MVRALRILGIVAKTHDSGVAFVRDGVPELVLEEERFNRDKKTKKFPRRGLNVGLEELGLGLHDIDAIATPWDLRLLRRTFASLLLRRFPLSLSLSLPSSHTSQKNDIVFLNYFLKRDLRKRTRATALPPIVNIPHHHSHAAMFFVSPFEEALVLVMDGYGDDCSSSAYVGRGNRLERLWSTGIMNSAGLVYTFVTEYLGFAGFGDEGKVMALAAYGGDTYVTRFRDVIRPTPDGGYAVNMDYFSYDIYGQLHPFRRKFLDTFGPPREKGEPISDRHRDIAFALQAVTEEIVLHRVRTLLKRHPQRDLCLSGGVALNCVANAKILEHTDVRRLWVPPCASDTGAPLGSALWHYHHDLGHARGFELKHALLGKAYGEEEIVCALDSAGLRYRRMDEDAAHRPGGARPGGGTDRRLVPGPVRDGAAGARQPLDPGRPAPSRHARGAQRQGQAARAVPAIRAGGAGRAGRRVLRDRPARPVHDAGAARAPREPRPHPGRRPRRRNGAHPDGRAGVEPALLRPDRGVRAPDGRADPAQHQLQPLRADRGLPQGRHRVLPAGAAWTCWCSAISTPPTAPPPSTATPPTAARSPPRCGRHWVSPL